MAPSFSGFKSRPVQKKESIMDLLRGYEIDQMLRWPSGRADRLARKGKLPHVKLPDGEIRFEKEKIESMIESVEPKNPVGEDDAGH